MPEGDAVWRTARRLHHALAGKPLTRSDLRWPSLATADLRGATTVEVVPRGKHLLHRLDNGLTLHSHLRMDGSWRVTPTTDPARAFRAHTVRAVLATAESTAVGDALGMLDLVRTRDEERLVGHLGPDLLGPDWDAAEAARRLAASPDAVGAALLEQGNLAGLGTIWTAESLFAQRLDPWRPAADLTEAELEALSDRAHRLLTASVRGQLDPRRGHAVYRRLRQPCRRCGTPIAAGSIGTPPHERTLFFCPTCQGAGSA
ncbi:MAG: DNA-formamidopyrimidine glycosylase family protein [Propionibacteriaceae bacterium]|nr:DNA-formamidopyrimidine glycosylase family protein [Propionibacteriaceae bacterium]